MFIFIKKTVCKVFADNYQSYDNAQHGKNYWFVIYLSNNRLIFYFLATYESHTSNVFIYSITLCPLSYIAFTWNIFSDRKYVVSLFDSTINAKNSTFLDQSLFHSYILLHIYLDWYYFILTNKMFSASHIFKGTFLIFSGPWERQKRILFFFFDFLIIL